MFIHFIANDISLHSNYKITRLVPTFIYVTEFTIWNNQASAIFIPKFWPGWSYHSWGFCWVVLVPLHLDAQILLLKFATKICFSILTILLHVGPGLFFVKSTFSLQRNVGLGLCNWRKSLVTRSWLIVKNMKELKEGEKHKKVQKT